jgi:hypothetical protein
MIFVKGEPIMLENKTITNEEEVAGDKKYSGLRFFCIILELIGWLLIIGGAMWLMYILSGGKPASENLNEISTILTIISWFSFDFAFIGLMAVILAHLARYIFDKNFRRGILLNSGDKILYLFAVFTVAWAIFRWFYYLKTIPDLNWRILLAQPLFLPTIAKVLVLVCIAQILKRILPIIEEHKSLV